MQGSMPSGQFVFEPPAAEPVPSVLYDEHLKRTSKSRMSPFAGYLMPLWYSSIAAEHRAVRETAGLFDCTHMGVLEFSGGAAAGVLNAATTNDIRKLAVGRAQYSYILDAAGNVLDDIIVYRRAEQLYMVVVNAANEPKIKAYLGELLAGRAVIELDPHRAGFNPCEPCHLRDMRDTATGADCRVDIALQGPVSIDVLTRLSGDESVADKLMNLKGFAFFDQDLAGIDCLICRTGYTGSKVGFELFVHPDHAPRLWNRMLEVGEPLGVLPCGLGARDSLRIEAGLPLYGHELDGPFHISPFEAGYGWAVKFDKTFFVGKAPMAKIAESYDMQVARLAFAATKGIRPIRPDDPILDANGACIGWVLSSAKVDEKQYALAYIRRDEADEGNALGVYYLARSPSQVQQGRLERMDQGQKAEADLTGTVVGRYEKF